MSDVQASLEAAREQGRIDRQESLYRGEKIQVIDRSPGKGDIHNLYEVGGLHPVTISIANREDKLEDRHVVSEAKNRPVEAVPDFLRQTFDALQRSVWQKITTESGSTANVVYISADPKHTITVANTGDSRAVLFIRDIASGKVRAERISKDHHFTDRPHHEFGDRSFPESLPSPEITQIPVARWLKDGNHEVYVMTASDGLFKALKGRYLHKLHESDLARVMQHYLGKGPASGRDKGLAKLFADTALAAGSWDDITVQIAPVTQKQTQDVVVATFDGYLFKGKGAVASEILAEQFEQIMRAEYNVPVHCRPAGEVLSGDATWELAPGIQAIILPDKKWQEKIFKKPLASKDIAQITRQR